MKLREDVREAASRDAVKASFKARSFKVGSYSVFSTLAVIAIAVVVVLLISALPSQYTQFDTTYDSLYALSEQSEQIVATVNKPITLYWMVTSGKESDSIDTLLNRYTGLNSNITVTKIDPTVYPTFATQYTSKTIYDNSVIAVSEDLSYYISYYEIYVYDYSHYQSDGLVDISFDGESCITSALNYLMSDDIPGLYTLTGHGETAVAEDLEDEIRSDNFNFAGDLSLAASGAIPEDCDVLMINAPTTDISSAEAEMILDYLKAGGGLYLATYNITAEDYPNLMSVTEYYGATIVEGVIVEGDSSYYASNYPTYLLPEIDSHEITDPLSDNSMFVILPLSQGIYYSEARSTVTAAALLTTTSSSYSKLAGLSSETYEKEDGDISGPIDVAVCLSEPAGDKTTHIVWDGSPYAAESSTNEIVSGGNYQFFLNSLNWIADAEQNIGIRAKTVNQDYITLDSGTTNVLTVVFMAVIPVVFLVIGLVIFIRRRRK